MGKKKMLMGGSASKDTFITEFTTTSIDYLIVPPVFLEGLDIYVDWGDGTSGNYTTQPIHTYALAGVYEVKMTGEMEMFNGGLSGSTQAALTDVKQWGIIEFSILNFEGCTNLEVTAIDIPKFRVGASLSTLFKDCPITNVNNIENWNVSNVDNINTIFQDAINFNQNINDWAVEGVSAGGSVFRGAISYNQPLDKWFNNGTPYSLFYFFEDARVFNQDLSNWDVSPTTRFDGMFFRARKFNSSIAGWDMSSAINLSYMLYDADVFTQDISGWNVGNVTNMENMLRSANSFDQDLGNWNIQSLTSANLMMLQIGVSTANYDSLLIGWNANPHNNDVNFNAGSSIYTEGGAAEQARTELIADGWVINDGNV